MKYPKFALAHSRAAWATAPTLFKIASPYSAAAAAHCSSSVVLSGFLNRRRMGPAKTLTKEELARLQQQGEHVFIRHGRVYVVDLNELMHPGGREVLEEHNGQDISALFEGSDGGHAHSRAAGLLLERYYRGNLAGAASAEDAGSERDRILRAQAAAQSGVVDESKPLLNQVMKLDPKTYVDWVAVPSTGHPHMFDTLLMERLTSAPWWTVPLLWLPTASFMLWLSHSVYGVGLPLLAALFVMGILVWQLFEYSVHRWLFHFDPTGPESIKMHFLMHGHHHKYPMDFDRLVFPPAPAILVASLWYLLLRALCTEAICYGLFGGGIVGYVMYDVTHYALHRVNSGFWAAVVGHKLKSSHMWHHYEDEQAGFGISSRLYDFIFRTTQKKQHTL